MDAWGVLSRTRQYGMSSPQPLQLREIAAYFEMFGVHEEPVRARYVRILQDMDGVYLEFAAERAERARRANAAKP